MRPGGKNMAKERAGRYLKRTGGTRIQRRRGSTNGHHKAIECGNLRPPSKKQYTMGGLMSLFKRCLSLLVDGG